MVAISPSGEGKGGIEANRLLAAILGAPTPQYGRSARTEIV